jgi:hypothetical protein
MGIANDAVGGVVLAAGVAILFFFKHREIGKAIEAFRDHFPRGGPPTPMHPSPAADEALLRRKSPKSDTD